MIFDFNEFIDRRNSWNCDKWSLYPEDVIPLWIADMDFRSPELVIQALHARAEHGVFGYQSDCPELREILIERLNTRHDLVVLSDEMLFMPGLVFGLNAVARATGTLGSGILVQTPAYPPFLSAPKNSNRILQTVPLACFVEDGVLRYEIDFDALEVGVSPETRLFMLCNPHNPVGRVYTRKELEGIAEFCLRHNLLICSDEIHCDLIYENCHHTSIASLSPEIADRCITLFAPSKTFNLPGLGFGVAVIRNPVLRGSVLSAITSVGAEVTLMGYAGGLVAYTDGQSWLDQLIPYLQDNRDRVVNFVLEYLPEIRVTQPEGTYLAWLDCRALNLKPDPYTFFLENARVAFSDGVAFGAPGFVRINYATTRVTLAEALERVRSVYPR